MLRFNLELVDENQVELLADGVIINVTSTWADSHADYHYRLQLLVGGGNYVMEAKEGVIKNWARLDHNGLELMATCIKDAWPDLEG